MFMKKELTANDLLGKAKTYCSDCVNYLEVVLCPNVQKNGKEVENSFIKGGCLLRKGVYPSTVLACNKKIIK